MLDEHCHIIWDVDDGSDTLEESLEMLAEAERVGITLANLSVLKNNRAKAIRFSTLDAICRALDCQPSDILEYTPDEQ